MASAAGFFEALEARVKAIDSLLCVGLDPHAAQVRSVTLSKRCRGKRLASRRGGEVDRPAVV